MMVLGTVDHYLSLRRRFPEYRHPYPLDWSLKEYGYFFILAQLIDCGAKRVLEFGAGYSTFFVTELAKLGIEYWSADRPSNLGIAANEQRWATTRKLYAETGAHFVETLLGEPTNELPDSYFDAVFSVSVIEHIPDEAMRGAVMEMMRVLRPGGIAPQTIDIYHRSKKAAAWHGAVVKAGMKVAAPHRHDWEWSGVNTTFLEPPKSRYVIFNSLGTKDPEASGLPYSSHFATTLHVATKPA